MHSPNSTNAQRIGERTLGVIDLAATLISFLRKNDLQITIMESCTGGSLAGFLTDIPRASEVISRSLVTYANHVKIAHGVPAETIGRHTVYSEQVAVAMAKAAAHGAGLNTPLNPHMVGIGVTGTLARIDPHNENSVPGEVYVGWAMGEQTASRKFVIPEPLRHEAKLHIAELVFPATQAFIEASR